jgi:MFS family permease
MFYVSSVLGLLSVVVLFGMKESLPKTERFSLSLLKISPGEVLEPNVYFPALIMILSAFSFGMVLTIIPDFSTHLGLQNKGIFFTYFTLSSIAVRIFAGKASDKYGRRVVLLIALIMLLIAMILLGFTRTYFTFIIAAIFFGQASGMTSPTIFAWTIDLASDEHRGRAMSTLYIALEIGIGLGALYSGWAYGNNPANFAKTFWSGAMLALVAVIILIRFRHQKLPHVSRTNENH